MSSIMAGDNVTLTCSVYPRSRISGVSIFQWQGPVMNDSTIIHGRYSSELVLTDVSASQAGLYNCSFSHRLGNNISTSTNLTIQGNYNYYYIFYCYYTSSVVPTPIPSIRLDYNTLLAGTEANLTCDYFLDLSVDIVILLENVVWFFNGSVLATTGEERISTNETTLTFSPLSTFDSGRYTCSLEISDLQPHYITFSGSQESTAKFIAVQSKFIKIL